MQRWPARGTAAVVAVTTVVVLGTVIAARSVMSDHASGARQVGNHAKAQASSQEKDIKPLVLDLAVATTQRALAYDYRTIGAALRRATALMTPRYARVFAHRFNETIRSTAMKNHAVVTVEILGSDFVNGSSATGRATCTVHVVQRFRGDHVPSGESQVDLTVRIDMLQAGNKWRTDGIEPS